MLHIKVERSIRVELQGIAVADGERQDRILGTAQADSGHVAVKSAEVATQSKQRILLRRSNNIWGTSANAANPVDI